MAGARGILGLGRRELALALAILPLTSFMPLRPDKDIAFRPAPNGGIPSPLDDPFQLVELVSLDSNIKLDLRYATSDNFTGRKLYDEPRAFLATAAAQALMRAHEAARRDGYGFTIFDAYRPWSVTRTLWNVTPRAKRNYVANPRRGSKHNRGCAIDLTLHNLSDGSPVEMPTDFDEFSARAHRDYMGASATAIANRTRLQHYLEAEGFRGMSNEWWHFDYKGWENFPIMDVPFDQIV